MKLSYSRVSCFTKCPYQFKLRYIDGYRALINDDPQNALFLGLALHSGIEKDTRAAIEEYYAQYPVINDRHIEEAMKLEFNLERVKKVLPEGGYHELEIGDDDFIGFIDYLVPVNEPPIKDGEVDWFADGMEFDLYDFKYTNNGKNYVQSQQLHLYKYYFEKNYPNCTIRDMYFMCVPKSAVRPLKKNKKNKMDEPLYTFRKRMISELAKKEITFMKIVYDPDYIIEFMIEAKHMIEAEEYPKQPTRLCDWCDYQQYCEKGEDTMLTLPKNERRKLEKVTNRKIWLYGAPFSGKTYLANAFPNPIMGNTDGNVKFIDAPYVSLRDEVVQEGRQTERIFMWQKFKDFVLEMEKQNNDFDTIVIDLLEDTYESCRLYMYDQLGISHESDDSFRAWDKVRSEFLRQIKRLLNLDYENIILISHEDTTKDLTSKAGTKRSLIKPNLNDKVAAKVAGMVDMVARVTNDDEDGRQLSFKANELIFGGGRLSVRREVIPCDFDALMDVYEEANENAIKSMGKKASKVKEEKPAKEEGRKARTPKVEEDAATGDESIAPADVADPDAEQAPNLAAAAESPEVVEEKPARSRRSRNADTSEEAPKEAPKTRKPRGETNTTEETKTADAPANEPEEKPTRTRRTRRSRS